MPTTSAATFVESFRQLRASLLSNPPTERDLEAAKTSLENPQDWADDTKYGTMLDGTSRERVQSQAEETLNPRLMSLLNEAELSDDQTDELGIELSKLSPSDRRVAALYTKFQGEARGKEDKDTHISRTAMLMLFTALFTATGTVCR